MTHVVVQLLNGPGDYSIAFIPWPALRQHGLANACHEERVEQLGVRLVRQQIAVMLAIRREHRSEREADRGTNLRDVLESRRAALFQLASLGVQPLAHDQPRLGGAGFLNDGKDIVQGALELGVGAAV